MSHTEQRVKRLEERVLQEPGLCNHPSISYLTDSSNHPSNPYLINPTEEEVEKLERELESCPNCKGADVEIVIFQQFKQ